MLIRTFIASIAILLAGVVLAQAYRWVDEDGVVHYSDRPREGAERIVLPQDTRPSVSYAAPESAAGATDTKAADTQTTFSYDSIEVSAPAAEETLWNIEGVLTVSINVQPALQPGHRVRVYLDGSPQMASGTTFQIQEVYRGVHNIQAEVLDETGKLMGRSQPNRFYVQQNTVSR